MSVLQLLPVGSVEESLLVHLQQALAAEFRVPCDILQEPFDPEFAFHPERQQYHSTEILARLESRLTPDGWRLLGVTGHDLYIPILTFVFGEAQMNRGCALVSFHRLRQQFHGLPDDPALLAERLAKESVHELGHTLGLTHCDDHRCVMAPSHAVEWIDIKDSHFCEQCKSRAALPNLCAPPGTVRSRS